MKISMIAWDVGHNPIGRVHIIAEALSRSFDVEIIGAQFPRYGNAVWQPLTGTEIPIRTFPGAYFPRHFHTMEAIARGIDGDIIYVFKPRLPSLELGIMAKALRPRPLILDIDDHELAFFSETEPYQLSDVKKLSAEKEFLIPYGRCWTRYADHLAHFADAITVSNTQLQEKYGGRILPHVKNEETFDPALYDRRRVRNKYGISADEKVILFIGTPRAHKGIIDIADALKTIGNTRYKLCIIGTPPDRKLDRLLRTEYSGYVHLFPDQPVSRLPENLRLGDLICLLQNPESGIAAYQMPSKFTDGLAMSIPMLCTAAPPLLSLADAGLIELSGETPLHEKIQDIFSNYTAYKHKAEQNRAQFLSHYSYRFAVDLFTDMIDPLLRHPIQMPREYNQLLTYHKAVFSKKQGILGRLLQRIRM